MKKYLAGVTEVITLPITIEEIGHYYFSLLIRKVEY
jgi:hypothetical protein